MKKHIKDLCKNIKLLVFDVDGVLPDGKIIISSKGYESKSFCVEDGTGAAIARFANLPLIFLFYCIISFLRHGRITSPGF